MRQKIILFYAIALLFGANCINAQTLYVKKTDGTQSQYELSALKKITLPENIVVIDSYSNLLDTFVMSDVRYFSFTDYVTSISVELENPNSLMVYPVPVNDILRVRYTSEKTKNITLQIIDLQGGVVREEKIITTNGVVKIDVDVNDLPTGYYNCVINNGIVNQSSRFVKQ